MVWSSRPAAAARRRRRRGATTATTAPARQAADGQARRRPRRREPEPQHLGHSRAPVPVLMYHVIAPAPPGAKYAGLWVSPDGAAGAGRGARARRAFTRVTLDAVLDGWAGKDTLPPHPVVLSFDDGYLSQGQEAGAILRAQGWPGVLNLALHNLDTPGGLTDEPRQDDDRRRLGDRRALAHPSRPHDARRRRAAPRGRRLARGDPASASASRSTPSATRPGATTRPSRRRCGRPATAPRRPRCRARRAPVGRPLRAAAHPRRPRRRRRRGRGQGRAPR